MRGGERAPDQPKQPLHPRAGVRVSSVMMPTLSRAAHAVTRGELGLAGWVSNAQVRGGGTTDSQVLGCSTSSGWWLMMMMMMMGVQGARALPASRGNETAGLATAGVVTPAGATGTCSPTAKAKISARSARTGERIVCAKEVPD